MKEVPHVIIIQGDFWEDDRVQVLHPQGCARWRNDWGVIVHECLVSSEIDAVGYDSLFPDGLEEGMYLVEGRVIVHPSGPWGPEEYDVEVYVRPLS